MLYYTIHGYKHKDKYKPETRIRNDRVQGRHALTTRPRSYPVDAVQVVHVVHGKHVEAPAPECVSVPQAAHAAVPPAENVPAKHGVHTPAENPDPGGQVKQAPVDATHVVQVLE